MVKRTFKWLWYSLAGLIIGIAVLVSIGRLLLPQAYRLKPAFEQYLADRTGAKVKVGEVYGAWRGFGPELRVRDIELLAPDSNEQLLTIGRFEAALDIPRSVFSWHTVMRRFEIEGLKTLVEFDDKGALVLPGLAIESGEDSDISAQYVIDALLRQGRVAITQTEIRYRRRQGDVIPLVIPEVSLRNAGGQHQAIGELVVHQGGAAKFVLEFTDYPLAASDQMTVYVESKALDLARLPLPTSALGVHFEDGDLQLQIWSYWRNGGWRDGQANLVLKQLQLVNDEQQRRQVDLLTGRLHFARAKDDVWYLHGDDVHWTLAGKKQPPLAIEGSVRREGDSQRWGFDVGALALADVLEWVRFSSAVPTELRQELASLNATAQLPELQVDFRLQDEVLADWAVVSRFETLRYESPSVPQIADLSGRALVGRLAGQSVGAARLQATGQAIDFHELFRTPLTVTSLDVGARWQQQDGDWLLDIPALQLRNSDAEVAARARLTMPATGHADLALAASLRNGVGANKSVYLPVAVMSADLVSYLDGAIETAHVSEAHSFLRRPLGAFPFAKREGVFDLHANVSGARYRFQPEWPTVTELTAGLDFTANSLRIDIERGVLAGLTLNQSVVRLDPLGGADALLTVQAKGEGSGQAAQRLLNQSPLQSSLRPVLDTLDVSGAITTDLNLAIPLHHSRDVEVRGKIAFGNANLRLLPIDLPFTGARGEVEFAEFGVTSGDVRMKALGGSLRATVSGDRSGATIAVTGSAEAAAVPAWYPHPLQDKVSGRFDYSGKVILPGSQQQGVQVDLQTDLRGLEFQAPAPYGKLADDIAPLRFKATVLAEQLTLEADYRQLLTLHSERQRGVALRTELLFPGTTYTGKQEGFSIHGQLDEMSAKNWIPFVADIVKTVAKTTTGNGSSVVITEQSQLVRRSSEAGAPALSLTIPTVDFYGIPITEVELIGRDTQSGYQLDIRAPSVAGDLLFTSDKPIQVRLEKFYH